MHEEDCIKLNSMGITLSGVYGLMGVCLWSDTRLTGIALTCSSRAHLAKSEVTSLAVQHCSGTLILFSLFGGSRSSGH